jgi:hypothetical protein
MASDEHDETRQERRERKLKAKREQLPKHGAGLRRSVVDAALRLARRTTRRSTRRGKR